MDKSEGGGEVIGWGEGTWELIQSSKIKAISGVVGEAHNLRVVYVWV